MKGKKDFLTSGAVYTVLGFLPTASRFFLLPLFLHYLTPSDFALISLNTMVASILPTFMTMGLENAMNRFYFDFVKHPKIEKAFVSTLVISIIGISLFLAVLFLLLGPQIFHLSFRSPRFTFYPFGITALLTALPGGLYALFLNYLRCRKDLKNYIILNLGLFLLTSIGDIIGVIFLRMQVEQLVWIKPMLTIPFVLIATAIILWNTGIRFDRRLLRLASSYTTPLLPHIIFGFVFIYTDRVMIEHRYAKDLTMLAVYNLAMAISNIIDIFEQALRNATFPYIYELLKENVYTNSEAVSKIHITNGLILITIMGGIALGAPIAGFYLLKPEYTPIVYLIPFILITSSIRFYYIVYAEPLFFFKKTKHISTSTFLQGISVILFNFILIPKFGLMGAVTANIISKTVQALYVYYTSMRIKVFRYKLNFILSTFCILIMIFACVSILTKSLMNPSGIAISLSDILADPIRSITSHKVSIHILSCLPAVFTACVIWYYVSKNKISLKQLW